MTLEEFRKKLDEDEAFRAEVEAKAKSLEEQYPDKSDSEREKMLCAAYGVEMPAGTEIDDDDIDAVAGGWGGPEATNGHEIGCRYSWSWYKNEGEAAIEIEKCQKCGTKLNYYHSWCYGKHSLIAECPACGQQYSKDFENNSYSSNP